MQMTKESVVEIRGFSNKLESDGMVHSEQLVSGNSPDGPIESMHTPEFGPFTEDPVSPSFPDPFASYASLTWPVFTAFDPRHERGSNFVATVVPI